MQNITNQQRAEMAYRALNKFSVLTGVEGEATDDQLSDLLCNLMHYADEQAVDFDECIKLAKHHYKNEIELES
jgi:hypothetical protein